MLKCGEIREGFAFETCAKCAIFTLARLDRKAVATAFTKHPGRETRESTFRIIKVWLKRIR